MVLHVLRICVAALQASSHPASHWDSRQGCCSFAGVQAVNAIFSTSDTLLWKAQPDQNPWTRQLGPLVEQIMLQDSVKL